MLRGTDRNDTHDGDSPARDPAISPAEPARNARPGTGVRGHLVRLRLAPSIIFRMSIQEYLVSASGQMSLPAAARHGWNLDNGGPVDVMDLGFGVLTAPRGTAR